MWVAILLTVLAASGNNIGKVLQKQGTKSLPRLCLSRKVLAAYVCNPTWLVGLIVDLSGALLMILAVARAPVSVVQPVSGSGLAIMAVFSHFYLHEQMLRSDWLAVTVAAAGTIGVGVSGHEAQDTSPASISISHLLAFLVWLLLLLGLLEWCAFFLRSQQKIKSDLIIPTSPRQSLISAVVVEEIAAGVQAGACFGLSASSVKLGFLLSSSLSSLLAPLGVASGVLLSAAGFFCQTRGFKEGRAVVVSTCAAVASMLTGVLVGVAALGEVLPSTGHQRLIRFLSWGAILLGIVMLLRSGKVGDEFSRKPGSSSGGARKAPLTLKLGNRLLSTPKISPSTSSYTKKYEP